MRFYHYKLERNSTDSCNTTIFHSIYFPSKVHRVSHEERKHRELLSKHENSEPKKVHDLRNHWHDWNPKMSRQKRRRDASSINFVCQLFPLLCHLHLITYYSCSKLDSKSQFHGKQTLRKCSHFERKSIEIHKLIIVLSSRAFNQIVSFTFSIAFTSFYFRSLNTFYKRIRSLCGSFNQA